MKLLCWNKGNSTFDTKKDELEILLNEHKPLILGVLEANVGQDQYIPRLNIDGYKVELDNLHENGFKTRTMVYINDQSKYVRRKDLEPPNSPTIWLEFSNSGKKPFLIFIGYREWRCLHIKKKPKSDSRDEQLERLEIWNQSWTKAESENKMLILLGDFNIDVQPWVNPLNILTPYQSFMCPVLGK